MRETVFECGSVGRAFGGSCGAGVGEEEEGYGGGCDYANYPGYAEGICEEEAGCV